MKEHIIKIENLTRWYDMGQNIFNRFNFQLDKWDFCFLTGKSWVGKTTLVKFLLRQLTPPHKMIFYKKEDLSRYDDDEVQLYRRNLWVVFQDYKIVDNQTAEENILLPLNITNEPIDQEHIKKILEILKISDKKDTLCRYLSWWEKQRVSIARALASNPEFIIADEPTGNLDRDNTTAIVDTLIELNKSGHTILFITHDQKLIEYCRERYDNVRVVEL